MADKRKSKSSRPFWNNKKRKSFTGKRKARDSNEARSGPSHEDDERDNVFIDQNARQSQTPKLFIDPKERITIPSYNVKPNFETLERLNGAYEALRRPNKRFKTESSIFNSLRTKGSTHYESVQAPVFKQASSSQHRSTEAQSNAWYQKKSKSRENLSLSQRSRMLDHRHDVIIPDQMTTPVYSSFSLPPLPSSSTTEEIFEWHNQPTTQNGRSSQNRHASVGLSEPSSSTAVQSLHQYWDTEQDPSKNIWISQANSVASAPPTIGGPSNIFMNQMAEPETNHPLYPEHELHNSTSSDAFSMRPIDHTVAESSIMSSPTRRLGTNSIRWRALQQSDQVEPIPLSQNTLVNFIRTPPQNKSLPVNGLTYFRLKSERLE